MFKIILGVACKILGTVFEKVAENSQKAKTGCAKIKDKCKKKKRDKKQK
jgi:hypothetical protein